MTKPTPCLCQLQGAIRPQCARGILGWLDAEGERQFDPLPCQYDTRRFLAGMKKQAIKPPRCYKKEKHCQNCGILISDNAQARCRPCAAKVNGTKSKGGPPNEAWRTTFRTPRRRPRQA